MDNNKAKSGAPLLASLRTIGTILRDVLTTAGSFEACCGITLARVPAADDMPTPSSCCGVRV
jgi:hypothetical protein